MKASKSLTSILAAAAVVGVISLAYAQTADTTAPPTDRSGQSMQSQGTASPDSSMQTPSATTTDTAVMKTERPAQADRN